MLRSLGIRFGLVGGLLAVSAVWHVADRTFNYVDVEARIDSVGTTCRLERASGRSTRLTEDGDCALMRSLLSAPEADGARLVIDTRVEVRFISPVDRVEHRGSLTLTGDRTASLKAGGTLEILANRTDATKLQEL